MRIFHRAVISFSSTALIQIANLIGGALLARAIGPENRGTLASIISLTSVISAVTSLSLGDALIYLCSSRDKSEKLSYLKSALKIALPITTVGFIFAIITVNLIGKIHHEKMIYVDLFCFNVIANHLCLISLSYILSDGDVKSWGLLRLIPPIVPAIGNISLFFFKNISAENYLMLQLAGNSLAVIGAVLCIAPSWRSGTRTGARADNMRTLFSYAIRLHPAALANTAREHLDRIMMTFLLSSAALGQYAIAGTLATLPMLLATTIDTIIFPKISSMPPHERRSSIIYWVPLCATFIAASSASIVAATPILNRLIFGHAYAESGLIGQILTISYALSAMKMMVGTSLKATGRALDLGKAEISTLVTMIIFVPMGVYYLGSVGAAAGMVLSQLVSFSYVIFQASRNLDIRPIALLAPSFDTITMVMIQLRTRIRI